MGNMEGVLTGMNSLIKLRRKLPQKSEDSNDYRQFLGQYLGFLKDGGYFFSDT